MKQIQEKKSFRQCFSRFFAKRWYGHGWNASFYHRPALYDLLFEKYRNLRMDRPKSNVFIYIEYAYFHIS